MNKIKKSLVVLVLLVVAFSFASCDLVWIDSNQKELSQALGATLMTGDYLTKEIANKKSSGLGWSSAEVGDNYVITLTNFDLATTGKTEFNYFENRKAKQDNLVKGDYILDGTFTVNKTATQTDFHAIANCKSLSGKKVTKKVSYELDATAKDLDENNLGGTLTANKFTFNDSDKTSALRTVLGWMTKK